MKPTLQLLALILTLALAACSNETHDPHSGPSQDGMNSNVSGGNNGDGGGN